jgi:hypothetical protein
MRTCANCKHWGGKESDYAAACNNPDSAFARMPFDGSCSLFEQRTASPVVNVSVAGNLGVVTAVWTLRPTCPMCHSSGAWVQKRSGGHFECLSCFNIWN